MKSKKIRYVNILNGNKKWIANIDLVLLVSIDDYDPVESTQTFLLEHKKARKVKIEKVNHSNSARNLPHYNFNFNNSIVK